MLLYACLLYTSIPGNSYTEKYLDIKVAVLVKKKTAKITHYQVSLDEVKALFLSLIHI